MFVCEFHCELGTVALEGGELFDPIRQATDRWYQMLNVDDSPALQSFELLYEHVDGRHVLLRYPDCRRYAVPDAPDKQLWRGSTPATGRVVGAIDALQWMLIAQHSVPPQMRKAADRELQPRAVNNIRPPDYWIPLVTLGRQAPELAAEVNWIKFAKRTYRRLIHLTDLLHGKSHQIDSPFVELGLFNRYRFSTKSWWGNALPPWKPTIDELPVSDEERSFLLPMLTTRNLLLEPAACLRARTQLAYTDEAPTSAELRLARETLVDSLPEFKAVLLDLRVAIAGYILRRLDAEDEAAQPNIAELQPTVHTDAKNRKERMSLRTAERKLERALIEHLRSARQCLTSANDFQDAPSPPPRPTRVELARMAGVQSYHVTRALALQGTKLALLWDAADNMELLRKIALPRRRRDRQREVE